jgi:hypothetical protein
MTLLKRSRNLRYFLRHDRKGPWGCVGAEGGASAGLVSFEAASAGGWSGNVGLVIMDWSDMAAALSAADEHAQSGCEVREASPAELAMGTEMEFAQGS